MVIFIILSLLISIFSDYYKTLKVKKVCQNGVCIPRVVWSHWGEDKLPEDIEEMVGVSRKSLKNFTFCLLTPSNLSHFIDVKFPMEYYRLCPANKGDFIRVFLILKYGGIYFDTSTYVNSGVEMEWFFLEALEGETQITTFPSFNHNYPFTILPGFFCAVENSWFMKRLKDEWDFALRIGVVQYCKQSCKKMGVKYRGTYGIPFVAVSVMGFNNETVRSQVHFLPENRSCERLIRECEKGRNRDKLKSCVRNRLLYDPDARAYPFIKVWHDFRDGKKFHIGDLIVENSSHSANVIGDERLYIVGAGFAGRNLARELKGNSVYGNTVAFLDDDPSKIGLVLDGVKVLGPIRDVAEYVQLIPANNVIIAIPGATNAYVKELNRNLKEAKFKKIYILPGISPGVSQVVNVDTHLVQTRIIDPRELLGRSPVIINLNESLMYLKGRRVLVTGAGGSIGSELCRQLLFGEVSMLYLFGQGENSVYQIDKELRVLQQKGVGSKVKLVPIIGDLKDLAFMNYILGKVKVDVIFHTAAFKHVPLMEDNPVAVIANNLFGTENIVRSAQKHGVESFVHITTDKAVDPVSIYGASKYLCELFLLDGDWAVDPIGSRSKMRFMVVRFGNVLGSRGSMVPLFKDQIEHGGPVTITHTEMRRWFMTIPEACSLVLQAGGVGESGNLYLLDMGEPIYIKDLAEQMIRFYGLVPEKDIKIEVIGLRPGERLGEYLWTKDEEPLMTPYTRILLLSRRKPTNLDIQAITKKLRPICFYDDEKPGIYRDGELLKRILKEYLPSLSS